MAPSNSLATIAAVTGAAALALLILRRKRKLQDIVRLQQSEASHREWAQRMQVFMFDIDGVIHVSGKEVPGAGATLAALRAAGKTVMFMTNNATKTPEDVVTTFAQFGAVAKPEEVMTSGIAAADYLQSRGLAGKAVYVVGMNALAETLKARAHVLSFGGEEDTFKSREDMLEDFFPSLSPPANEVAAVVVGADFRFNYYKLARAANYLKQNPSCLFVATNPDPCAMLGKNTIVPAAGSLVEAIACASGRRPDIVCGKPSASLARHLLTSRGFDPSTTCMVGDRTDTDIAFGRGVGMQTLFVESGTMTQEEAASAPIEHRPHFISASIAVLQSLL